jgi:hypothetical protein
LCISSLPIHVLHSEHEMLKHFSFISVPTQSHRIARELY